jgi:probable phosphoglycerate mutase
MTTILLIRHGLNDFVGKAVAGRRPGVHLNAEGAAQAARLADRLAGENIAAIYSSPMERARETAGPLARRLNLPIQTEDGVNEWDCGTLTGMTMAELARDPVWTAMHAYRLGTRLPDGELAVEVQARFVAALERLRHRHDAQTIAVFSHADPIKSALLFYLGASLESLSRLEIEPASISTLQLSDTGARILRVNAGEAAVPGA